VASLDDVLHCWHEWRASGLATCEVRGGCAGAKHPLSADQGQALGREHCTLRAAVGKVNGER
jgi:hypothetical protein